MDRRKFLGLSAMSLPMAAWGNVNSRNMKHEGILLPKSLQKGDRIGLCTPSSPTSAENVEKAIQSLESLGFETVLAPNCNVNTGFLAGDDKMRAEDIHTLMRDENVQGIWCVRGGYGSARILPYLDYQLIREARKPIIGYSDITALLHGILLGSGLIGYHGPVGTSTYSAYTIEHILPIIQSPGDRHVIEPYRGENSYGDPKVLLSGEAQGAIIGGNLTVFASLCGTPYMPSTEGKILILEDIGEEPYRLDRMFNQLRQNFNLNGLAGILLGQFTNCEPKDPSRSLSLEETILQAFQDITVPIMYNYSFGHVVHLCSFPIGAQVEMNTENGTLTIWP
jgi:muramoyltetrapeptide carboxypeptidase